MNIKLLQAQAQNIEYISVLKSFDVKMLDKFLKRWDKKTYKVYHAQSYQVQKTILCKEVVRLADHFKDEDVERAKKNITKWEAEK